LRENLEKANEKAYGRGKPFLKRSLRTEPGGLKFKNGYNCKQGEKK